MTNQYKKTVILTLIKERKDILFGSLKHPKTNHDRHAAWKEVHEKAASLGAISANKKWDYLRDITWANWKRSLMKKRDKKGKTGKGGGAEVQYSAADNLILDIIGRDTPILEGLKVPESMTDDNPIILENDEEFELPSIPNSPCQGSQTAAPGPSTSTHLKNPLFRFPGGGKRHVNQSDSSQKASQKLGGAATKTGSPKKRKSEAEIRQEFQSKKMKLQIDLMELDKRIKTIQLFKMELEQGLPPSEYTREFHNPPNCNTQ